MATKLTGTREALHQFTAGYDFEPADKLLGDLSPEQATTVPPGSPYSVAGLVGHMLYWQDRWLAWMFGEPAEEKQGKLGDWPHVAAGNWTDAREKLIAGIQRAREAAETEDLSRQIDTDTTVEERLLAIVLHNTYHLGQVAVVRQLIGCWPPEGHPSWDEW